MKKITWIIGGLEVPGVGISQEGQTVNADNETAVSLIAQGIAVAEKPKKPPKQPKTSIIEGVK